MISMKILYYLVHPDLPGSVANATIARQLPEHADLTVINLYDTYPNFAISCDAEQERINNTDVLLFQHPMHWYSVPALLKQWMDLVLEQGYAYGTGGDALKGKYWGHIITTGGSEQAYQPTGYNRFTLTEICRHLEATAHMCQCHWLPPQIICHARHREAEQLDEFTRQVQSMVSDLLEQHPTKPVPEAETE